jgi:hypothetical protein
MKDTFKPGWPAMICYYIAAYIIFSKTVLHSHRDFMMTLLSAAFFILSGSILARWHATIGDRKRTKDAADTLAKAVEKAETGGMVEAALFLRPFALTNRILYHQAQPPAPLDPVYFERSDAVDYERVLS